MFVLVWSILYSLLHLIVPNKNFQFIANSNRKRDNHKAPWKNGGITMHTPITKSSIPYLLSAKITLVLSSKKCLKILWKKLLKIFQTTWLSLFLASAFSIGQMVCMKTITEVHGIKHTNLHNSSTNHLLNLLEYFISLLF